MMYMIYWTYAMLCFIGMLFISVIVNYKRLIEGYHLFIYFISLAETTYILSEHFV